jgi:hypothetical protein
VSGGLYDLDGNVQVGTAAQNIPALTGTPVWGNWEILLVDHDNETAADDGDKAEDWTKFGGDYIAGGTHDDQIFGQLGNDTIQGDGSIDFASDGSYDAIGTLVGATRGALNALLVNPSFESANDGDDYIEGNGGNDVIFGNLGQDDILGGSSNRQRGARRGRRQPREGCRRDPRRQRQHLPHRHRRGSKRGVQLPQLRLRQLRGRAAHHPARRGTARLHAGRGGLHGDRRVGAGRCGHQSADRRPRHRRRRRAARRIGR